MRNAPPTKTILAKAKSTIFFADGTRHCLMKWLYGIPCREPRDYITFFLGVMSAISKAGLDKHPRDVSKEEWRKALEDEEYAVTREAATERPFTGIYNKFVKDGKYYCLCCGALLFSSDTKYQSGCGWPTFWAAEVTDEKMSTNIVRLPDNSHGMNRMEVRCKQCNAHLGHVFDDGPQPTGERYCINSCSLNFQDKSDDETRPV